MDPEIVAAVVGALGAGALAGVEDSATKAVEGVSAAAASAWIKLRDAVRGLFDDGSPGAVALAEYEEEPEAWEGGLRSALSKVDVEDPSELLALVDAFRSAEQATSADDGARYSVRAYNSTGVVTGPNASPTFYFDGRGDDSARPE